jgi:nucleoside-diphosphate-sugar epimerase
MKTRSCLIIGAKGFIGSAITTEAIARGYAVTTVTQSNYKQRKGRKAELLINAAGNAVKFLDDQDPLEGFSRSVTTTLTLLQNFQYEHCIHISSSAVYPNESSPSETRETLPLDPQMMTNYGFHKWMSEQVVRHYAPGAMILRLGGCVGKGLKKNAVFDLLNNHPLHVHPDSSFQYINTKDIAHAIFSLYEGPYMTAQHDLQMQPLNLSGKGVVSIRTIAHWANRAIPATAETLPLVNSQINIEKAEQYLRLPETGNTIKTFITRELASS